MACAGWGGERMHAVVGGNCKMGNIGIGWVLLLVVVWVLDCTVIGIFVVCSGPTEGTGGVMVHKRAPSSGGGRGGGGLGSLKWGAMTHEEG